MCFPFSGSRINALCSNPASGVDMVRSLQFILQDVTQTYFSSFNECVSYSTEE